MRSTWVFSGLEMMQDTSADLRGRATDNFQEIVQFTAGLHAAHGRIEDVMNPVAGLCHETFQLPPRSSPKS